MIKKKEKEFIRFKEVSTPALNVRRNPSPKAEIIGTLSKETIVECDKNYDSPVWAHIITDPDVEGFVMKEYLQSLDLDTIAAFGDQPILKNSFTYTCDSNEAEDKKDDIKEKEE